MHLVSKYINTILASLFVSWLLVIGAFIYSFNEGRIFPVTSKVNITDIQSDVELGFTIIGGDFEKYRDCTRLGVKWYYSDRSGSVQVISYFDEEAKIRKVGKHHFDRLSVRLPEKDILRNSFAVIEHDCYNGWLWTTKTIFYLTD